MPAIIAFAKDWDEDPTSNHHVLRELARSRRVLWLNSVATRTPSLTSGRDLGKVMRKLAAFAKGPVQNWPPCHGRAPGHSALWRDWWRPGPT